MKHIQEIDLGVQALDRFASVVGQDGLAQADRCARDAREALAGRTVWNVNSTGAGGGVAEMLHSLLPYARGAGIPTRWMVIEGNTEFFQLTKRLHHALHGSAGDGTPLDEVAHRIYEQTLDPNLRELRPLIQPGDVVILHDPQTAGLAPALIRRGALVIWRCHVGRDESNVEVVGAWGFLGRYLRKVPAFVFSRNEYVPTICDRSKTTIVPPSIDAFSPKNQEMDEATVRAILSRIGLSSAASNGTPPAFLRPDGTVSRVDRQAEIFREGPPAAADVPVVVQVSRWDPLKDPLGVMHGFARAARNGLDPRVQLMLVGPSVAEVSDDPEGAVVYKQTQEAWHSLDPAIRRRVQLVSLPMDDLQENAAMVNAIQRHATVVIQKSLHEGFGLTVTEAMWKARPVLASAVGGIQDQITDGRHGRLLQDPCDSQAFAAALTELVARPEQAGAMGERARERVRTEFLGVRHLTQYVEIFKRHLSATSV